MRVGGGGRRVELSLDGIPGPEVQSHHAGKGRGEAGKRGLGGGVSSAWMGSQGLQVQSHDATASDKERGREEGVRRGPSAWWGF